jgi:Fe-S oxidoreductase
MPTRDELEQIKVAFEELGYTWAGYAGIDALYDAIDDWESEFHDTKETLAALKREYDQLVASGDAVPQGLLDEADKLNAKGLEIIHKIYLLEKYLEEEILGKKNFAMRLITYGRTSGLSSKS